MSEKKRTIFRAKKGKKNSFTQIVNSTLDDNRLSLRAFGLLIQMLKRPDDWVFNQKELLNHFQDGKDTLTATLKELIAFSYVRIVRKTREKGRMTGYVTLVYESPELTISGKSEYGSIGSGETGSGGIGSGETGSGETGSGETRPTNTDLTNTELFNNTNINKNPSLFFIEDNSLSLASVKTGQLVEAFDDFWAAYPGKGSKKAAKKAWYKHASKIDLQIILSAIAAQKQEREHCEALGVWKEDWAHAVTWLNQNRWENETESYASLQARSQKSRRKTRTELAAAQGRELMADLSYRASLIKSEFEKSKNDKKQ